MEFIKIAYCVTIPVLLFFSLIGTRTIKNYSKNLLAVTNILLIGYSFFLAKQLIGTYQLMRTFHINYEKFFTDGNGLILRLIAIVMLPLLFLLKFFRRNLLLPACLVVLIYSIFPYSSWNTYDLLFKIAAYFCLLCSAYALLWLLNKLPYQSPVV
jgi:hypothetical protein